MIYTIGRTAAYEDLFARVPDLKKSGREGDYPGGSVWRTKADVEQYLSERQEPGFSIYGVIADWERDTVKSDHGPWHDLLVDSLLVRITDESARPST